MPDTHHPTVDAVDADDGTKDAVTEIATTLTDLIEGYAEMADRAEVGLKPVVQRLSALHKAHLAEVQVHLPHLGVNADPSGSLMGVVHRTVATVRDWMDQLDWSAIDAIADGEEKIIGQYDDAIKRCAEHGHATEMLARQRGDLKAQVDALPA